MRATAVLLCLLSTAVAGDLAYDLEPGTALVFAADAEATGGVAGKATMTMRVWVLRRNADGTCRTVFSRTTTGFGPDRTVWAWCDMAPDGSYAPNITTQRDLQPEMALPLLPKPGAASRTLDLTTFVYTTEAPNVFSYTTRSAVNTVYGVTHTARVTMKDRLPAVIELTQEQTLGLASKQKATVRLKERRTIDAARLKSLTTEIEAYFAAARRYDEAVELKTLEDALAKTTIESIRKSLQAAMDAHAPRAKHEQQNAAQRAKFVGKASPEWETVDFAGITHSVKRHRGRVMVLDFWFRGCGWCVMAMPAMKRIVEHFRGRPVVLLGMNVDRSEADARHVIEGLELNYPNLKARGINDKYEVRGYPTIVLIDKRGVVRALHLGFTANLREDLIAEVEKLLAE